MACNSFVPRVEIEFRFHDQKLQGYCINKRSNQVLVSIKSMCMSMKRVSITLQTSLAIAIHRLSMLLFDKWILQAYKLQYCRLRGFQSSHKPITANVMHLRGTVATWYAFDFHNTQRKYSIQLSTSNFLPKWHFLHIIQDRRHPCNSLECTQETPEDIDETTEDRLLKRVRILIRPGESVFTSQVEILFRWERTYHSALLQQQSYNITKACWTVFKHFNDSFTYTHCIFQR